jgi:hypothetical protein
VGAAVGGLVYVVPAGNLPAPAAAAPAADARQCGGAAEAPAEAPRGGGSGGGFGTGGGSGAGGGGWANTFAAAATAVAGAAIAAAGAAAGAVAAFVGAAAGAVSPAASAAAADGMQQHVGEGAASLSENSMFGRLGVVGGRGQGRYHLQASHLGLYGARAAGNAVAGTALGLRDRLLQRFRPMPAGHGGEPYANVMPAGSWFDWHRHRPGDLVSRLAGALGWPWALGMRAQGFYPVQVAVVFSSVARGLGLRTFDADGNVIETCFFDLLSGVVVHLMGPTAEGAFNLLPSQGGGWVEHAVTRSGEGVAGETTTVMYKVRGGSGLGKPAGWGRQGQTRPRGHAERGRGGTPICGKLMNGRLFVS